MHYWLSHITNLLTAQDSSFIRQQSCCVTRKSSVKANYTTAKTCQRCQQTCIDRQRQIPPPEAIPDFAPGIVFYVDYKNSIRRKKVVNSYVLVMTEAHICITRRLQTRQLLRQWQSRLWESNHAVKTFITDKASGFTAALLTKEIAQLLGWKFWSSS